VIPHYQIFDELCFVAHTSKPLCILFSIVLMTTILNSFAGLSRSAQWSA
jgi:hypothetical protein